MTGPLPTVVWQQFKTGRSESPDITVGIAASMTAQPLEPYLGAYLLGRGFKSPNIVTGSFNQLPQACRDHQQFFGAEPDVIALLWRLEDVFPDIVGSDNDILKAIDDFAGLVRTLRKNFSGTIIVSIPPYPTIPEFDAREIGQSLTGEALYTRVCLSWIAHLSAIDRVRILNVNGLLLQEGIDGAYDARKWFLYRQPWTERFWQAIGRQLGRTICAQTLSAKKCIVVDADNTLWGGVIGEDGIEGIKLSNEFPGSAYREFQKYLLHLQKKGVLIAIASKNNPADFYEVMDKHDAMVLRREHIAAFEIHWESKVDSIRRLVKALNIGLDSIVFVDDSPKELGEVLERLPEVTCVLVPEEVAELPACLAGTDFFDMAEITDEDRRRTQMIQADRSRQELHESMTEEEFKAALALEMTIFRVEKQHLARITQLVNKTNQFNLTTIRRTADEIETLSRSAAYRLLGMELKDRYGDYGLVGVAVLEKKGRICVIDTLLMSCRVLGRNAESGFIAQLAIIAAEWGCDTIQGQYLATAKNGMVKDLYKNHSFALGDDNTWAATPAKVANSPPHIKVKVIL